MEWGSSRGSAETRRRPRCTITWFTSVFFFFSSRRRHTRLQGDWSSDVCSSDLAGLVHVPGRDAVRQGREHDVGTLERGVVGLEEPVALHPLARGRVRGGKSDRSPRMPRQEAQQLLADIPGGSEHGHGHLCMIIHRTGKICSPGGNARAAAATCGSYSTRSRRGLGRYARPTFPHGFPSTRTTSAVKSKRPWNRLEPTPYMSTGTSCSSNWRIFSTLKPPHPTVFTCRKPSRSCPSRTFQTSRGLTPAGLNRPISGITDF